MQKLKDQVKNFWTNYPCAKNIIPFQEGSEDFFKFHDRVIDTLTPYHNQVYKYENYRGKRVLEIGCGMGVYAWRFARQAKEFYAVDIAPKSVELTKRRFELYGLNSDNIMQADAENLPFCEGFFDFVVSHGVIHHSPDTQKAADEIHRVLKPGGSCIVMIYHKNSIFYWFDLMLAGRIKYLFLKFAPEPLIKIFSKRKKSILDLKAVLKETKCKDLGDLVLRFSDGHFNPHTKVYSLKEARKLFSKFKKVSVQLYSPVNRLFEKIRLVDRRLGWGLFIFAEK